MSGRVPTHEYRSDHVAPDPPLSSALLTKTKEAGLSPCRGTPAEVTTSNEGLYRATNLGAGTYRVNALSMHRSRWSSNC